MKPDTHDRLKALYEKMSNFPERGKTPSGDTIIAGQAFVAFLDARKIIETEMLPTAWSATRDWRPIDDFQEHEPETPNVLVFDGEVKLGFFDEDDDCWRDATDDSVIEPTKWKRLADA